MYKRVEIFFSVARNKAIDSDQKSMLPWRNGWQMERTGL